MAARRRTPNTPKPSRAERTGAKGRPGSSTQPLRQRAVLFAPWRIEFILAPKQNGCFLCTAAKVGNADTRAWKELLLLHRDRHAVVMLNRYPYTGGHLLVAPRRHTADLSGLSREESASLWELSRSALKILTQVLAPQGANLGMNLGKAAGAGVADHLHMHLLPRWIGDTNFLPVVGQTQTVPLALESLWEDLRGPFKRLTRG